MNELERKLHVERLNDELDRRMNIILELKTSLAANEKDIILDEIGRALWKPYNEWENTKNTSVNAETYRTILENVFEILDKKGVRIL